MSKDKIEYTEGEALSSVVKTWGGIGTAIGLISGASALLVSIFDWDKQITYGVIGLSVVILLFVGIMIDRQSRRQIKHDKAQDAKLEQITRDMDSRMDRLEDITMESYRSAIRSEMNSMMRHYPSEHATIIKYAERYFGKLKGNWVEIDLFMTWIKKEEAAGRPVNVPRSLLDAINSAEHQDEDFLIK